MIFSICNDDELHSIDQIKRFEKSTGKKIKPISLDLKSQSAKFEGSDGSIYDTTLSGCTCVDYAMHQLPCKHMYKLATECNLININSEPFKTYKEYSKMLNAIKKKLNKLSIEQLNTVSKYIDTLLK